MDDLKKAARDVLDVFDHPKADESGMWLVYDRSTGAAFNWHALGPKLRALRAATRAAEAAGDAE
jgi:hypothetical protein